MQANIPGVSDIRFHDTRSPISFHVASRCDVTLSGVEIRDERRHAASRRNVPASRTAKITTSKSRVKSNV